MLNSFNKRINKINFSISPNTVAAEVAKNIFKSPLSKKQEYWFSVFLFTGNEWNMSMKFRNSPEGQDWIKKITQAWKDLGKDIFYDYILTDEYFLFILDNKKYNQLMDKIYEGTGYAESYHMDPKYNYFVSGEWQDQDSDLQGNGKTAEEAIKKFNEDCDVYVKEGYLKKAFKWEGKSAKGKVKAIPPQVTPEKVMSGKYDFSEKLNKNFSFDLSKDCQELYKTDLYKEVNAYTSTPECSKARGESIWDGDTLEHQVINLLAKAAYRVFNDGDDVFMDSFVPGYSELVQAKSYASKLGINLKIKDIKDIYTFLSKVIDRIKSGKTTKPDRNLEKELRQLWEEQYEDERRREEEYWRHQDEMYNFSNRSNKNFSNRLKKFFNSPDETKKVNFHLGPTSMVTRVVKKNENKWKDYLPLIDKEYDSKLYNKFLEIFDRNKELTWVLYNITKPSKELIDQLRKLFEGDLKDFDLFYESIKACRAYNNKFDRHRWHFSSNEIDWSQHYPSGLHESWEYKFFDKVRDWVAKYLKVPTSKLGFDAYRDKSNYEESEMLQNYGPGRKIYKYKNDAVGIYYLNQNLIIFYVDK